MTSSVVIAPDGDTMAVQLSFTLSPDEMIDVEREIYAGIPEQWGFKDADSLAYVLGKQALAVKSKAQK